MESPSFRWPVGMHVGHFLYILWVVLLLVGGPGLCKQSVLAS